jgi:hypothetical protein
MPLNTTPPIRFHHRSNGWTPQRQLDFIRALAQTRSVAHAAQSVGLSASSGHRLRRHPGAQAFAAAWDAVMTDRTPHVGGMDIHPGEGAGEGVEK